MNSVSQIPYIRNEKKWYILSIYYAKDNWDELIKKIKNFYQTRQNQFCNCLIFFSKERGENIRAVFITSVNDGNNYSTEIENYFQKFIVQNPSISKIQFPYGETIWCNYPNNSLVWNRFKLMNYSDQYIEFHQRTMDLVLNLLKVDISDGALFSTGFYLITKGLYFLNKEDRENELSKLHLSIYEDLRDSSEKEIKVKCLIDKFDIDVIGNTIEMYIDENEKDCSAELTNWLISIKMFLKYCNYRTFSFFTLNILGLSEFNQIVLTELLNLGYNHYANNLKTLI